jgi:hypothetical protein
MNTELEIKIDSTIYDRINALRISDAERQVAINAMQDAELLVDAFLWMTRKIEQLGSLLFLKPSVRH